MALHIEYSAIASDYTSFPQNLSREGRGRWILIDIG